MRFNVTTVALLAVLPFVTSTSIGKNDGPQACKSSEFWWKDKTCCLPHGGPPQPPSPPKGSSCPPASHYWSNDKGCCAPRHPPPDHGPQPQCPKGSTWYPSLYKCLPNPHTTTPPTPAPSKTPSHGGYNNGGNDHGSDHGGNGNGGYNNGGSDHGGNGHDGNDHGGYNNGGSNHGGSDNGGSSHGGYNNGGNGHDGSSHGGYRRWNHKRDLLKSRLVPCPTGLEACPISGLGNGEYECLDTTVELKSCGGCVALGKGQDCTAIAGAWNVGCENARCIVYTCSAGFKLSPDGGSCLPL